MSKMNYIPIQSPIEISLKPITNPEKHLEISTRGVIVSLDESIDVGTTVQVHIKLVSMTGSMEFPGKVFECNLIGDGNYEVYIKFYGISHDKENEIISFIQDTL